MYHFAADIQAFLTPPTQCTLLSFASLRHNLLTGKILTNVFHFLHQDCQLEHFQDGRLDALVGKFNAVAYDGGLLLISIVSREVRVFIIRFNAPGAAVLVLAVLFTAVSVSRSLFFHRQFFNGSSLLWFNDTVVFLAASSALATSRVRVVANKTLASFLQDP